MLSNVLSESTRLKWVHRASRDNARTPVQWSAEENGGFTTGTPWFHVNENYREINVENQLNDPDSLLSFYKKAIALRKMLPVVRDGDYVDHAKYSGSLYVYSRNLGRKRLLVICSFAERPVRFRAPYGFDLSHGKLLLSNYGSELSKNGFMTKPYECRVYEFT